MNLPHVIERGSLILFHSIMHPFGYFLPVAAFVVASALSAAGSLADRSPFLPAGFGEEEPVSEAPAQSAGDMENLIDFKGFYELGGEYRLLVGKKRGQSASWLGVGESSEDLEVLDFDLDNERVRARLDGREGWVEMAQIASNPSPAAGPPGPQRVRPTTTASRTPSVRRPSGSTAQHATPSPTVRRPPVIRDDGSRPPSVSGADRQSVSRQLRRVPPSRVTRSTEPPSVGPSVQVPAQRPSGPPPTPSPTRRPDSAPPTGVP